MYSFWERLKDLWLISRPSRQGFHFDEGLRRSLHELACREGRRTHDVAREMLTFAIDERLAANEYLMRWRTLTPREQQVVALLCKGYNNRQAAEALVIAPDTIKTHTRNATQKLGLRSKIDLLRALEDWDFGDWMGV